LVTASDGNIGTNAAPFSCPDAQGHGRLAMQRTRDVWNTTFFHRAIRKTIGESLSQSKSYDLSQPLPGKMRALLDQLDEADVEGEATDERLPNSTGEH
jgi:hypothetical protein